jgi:hypothetical protein
MKEGESSIQSLVQTAERKPKFHSNLMVADPFTVRSVFGNIVRRDISRGMPRNLEAVFELLE